MWTLHLSSVQLASLSSFVCMVDMSIWRDYGRLRGRMYAMWNAMSHAMVCGFVTIMHTLAMCACC